MNKSQESSEYNYQANIKTKLDDIKAKLRDDDWYKTSIKYFFLIIFFRSTSTLKEVKQDMILETPPRTRNDELTIQESPEKCDPVSDEKDVDNKAYESIRLETPKKKACNESARDDSSDRRLSTKLVDSARSTSRENTSLRSYKNANQFDEAFEEEFTKKIDIIQFDVKKESPEKIIESESTKYESTEEFSSPENILTDINLRNEIDETLLPRKVYDYRLMKKGAPSFDENLISIHDESGEIDYDFICKKPNLKYEKIETDLHSSEEESYDGDKFVSF